MASKRVTWVQKRGAEYPPHERILSIGGPGWSRTLDQAIRDIESGYITFYVQVGVSSVFVIVTQYNGKKYIKTTADGYAPNKLLRLPRQ